MVSNGIIPRILSAADLFALSQGEPNSGGESCHWCRSDCGRQWTHEDDPPVAFVRRRSVALNPAGPFVCRGCWLWARRRVTVQLLDGSWKDGQTASVHSWFVTERMAWVITPLTLALLWEHLLMPPRRFVLALVEDGQVNHVCLARANDMMEVKSTTPLVFTVNNVIHLYTTYELDEVSRSREATGTEPGVQALVRLLGLPPQPAGVIPRDKPKPVGRPPAPVLDLKPEARLRRTVRVSGG